MKYLHGKSLERLPRIIELYNEGKNLTEIEVLTGVNADVVKRHLVTSGIDVDRDRNEAYQKKLQEAIQLYKEGKSQTYIEQELHLTRKTIRNLLKKEENLRYRSKSEQWAIRWGNEDLRQDAFEILTPESAYWIGFIYTDGSISGDEREGYTTELLINRKDRSHLEKLRIWLRCNSEIKDVEQKPNNLVRSSRFASRFRVGSQRIHQSLKNLGFTNQKSYDAVPHESLKNNRDFWRGVIDGDGGIYSKGSKNYQCHIISLCGTLDTICEFIWFCETNLSLKNKKYPTKRKGKELYEISYYGKEAINIADCLYKDAPVYLDRKYQTYLDIIQSPGGEANG